MSRLRILILPAILCLMLIGCDRQTAQAKPAAPPSREPARTGTAKIVGFVRLSGRPPVMAAIANQPCHAGARPLTDESVVVEGSALRNVVIYLEDAPAAAPAAELQPVLLDQIDCRYVPHVLALRTGQTLRVTSSDPTLHNVHGLCESNAPFNFALVSPGQKKDLSFEHPEVIQVRCDVHPWMKAYVHVFDHPWFALSGADGKYEIKNVPAGSYTLEAWQEKYGVLKTHVVAADAKTSTADFTFQSGL